MKRISFFDTKPYDKQYFDKLNDNYEISYFEGKLNKKTEKKLIHSSLLNLLLYKVKRELLKF